MKDPVCGMDVAEEDAHHMLIVEQDVLYFCSEQCRETYASRYGVRKPTKKKGLIRRFLEKIAKGTEDSYGNTPPTCH
ncbi:MAG TPA: hypothetical protein VJ955_02330 [Desulfuromonadales bacterium]|nr:hypothetical protein [Desulfuromonadales bacterium]